jgi:uncharacterized protein YrrD
MVVTVIFEIRFTLILSLLISRSPTFPYQAKIPLCYIASISYDKLL